MPCLTAWPHAREDCCFILSFYALGLLLTRRGGRAHLGLLTLVQVLVLLLTRSRHRQTLVTQLRRRMQLAAVQHAVALYLLRVPVYVVVAMT